MKLTIGISLTKSYSTETKQVILPFAVFAQASFLLNQHLVKALTEKGFTEYSTVIFADDTLDIGTSLSILTRKAMDSLHPDWLMLISLDTDDFPIDMPERCEDLIKGMDFSTDTLQGFPESNIYLIPREIVETGTLNFTELGKTWAEELNSKLVTEQ